MNKKNKTEKWEYWLVKDGSVDVDELQQLIDENNLKIKIVICRQGEVASRQQTRDRRNEKIPR